MFSVQVKTGSIQGPTVAQSVVIEILNSFPFNTLLELATKENFTAPDVFRDFRSANFLLRPFPDSAIRIVR